MLKNVDKKSTEIMELVKDIARESKVPFVCWLGPKSFIVIDQPDDIQTVMNSSGCIEKSEIYKFFNRGLGIFAAPGVYDLEKIVCFLGA